MNRSSACIHGRFQKKTNRMQRSFERTPLKKPLIWPFNMRKD